MECLVTAVEDFGEQPKLILMEVLPSICYRGTELSNLFGKDGSVLLGSIELRQQDSEAFGLIHSGLSEQWGTRGTSLFHGDELGWQWKYQPPKPETSSWASSELEELTEPSIFGKISFPNHHQFRL